MKTSSITALVCEIKKKRVAVIGIDGYLGVGKTTIAALLSRRLGYTCIHLDDYLDPGKGRFIDNLDIASLEQAVRVRPLIIEGLCLMEVLNRLYVHAELLIFVSGINASRNTKDSRLFDEVDRYFQKYLPSETAGVIFSMNDYTRNSSDEVDIAYIKAKTAVSIVLAIGGILSILVGALVFVLGLESGDTALIKLAGVEVSAKGIGGVILVTSAVWAYLAYLARPIYRRRREIKETTKDDGTIERHEFESSTQALARPERDA